MNIKQMLFALLALTSAIAATAAEPGEGSLSLYGLALKNSTLTDFKAAAYAAGATGGGEIQSGHTVFTAKPGAVPAFTAFSVLTDPANDQVVMVQFSLNLSQAGADEKLRQMLVEKYGYPKAGVDSYAHVARDFTSQYPAEDKYEWGFKDGMKLVYKKPFMGPRMLTYIDVAKFDALLQRANQASATAAKKAVAANKDQF